MLYFSFIRVAIAAVSLCSASNAIAQNMQLRPKWNGDKFVIATSDPSLSTDFSCPNGFKHVVINLDLTNATIVSLTSEFRSEGPSTITIRKGSEVVRTVLRDGTEQADYEKLNVGGVLYGCLSQFGFKFDHGTVEILGYVANYKIAFEERLDHLTDVFGVNVKMTYSNDVFFSGNETEQYASWDSLHRRSLNEAPYPNLPYLGKFSILTGPIPLQFEARDPAKPPLDGDLEISFELLILDGDAGE